jgi:mannose-6-phosphate isomerase-like protein (cupin superfamily)
MERSDTSPRFADPLALSRNVTQDYHNVSLGDVNDHEIRMSVMTRQFAWHCHPDTDETFVGVDGELIVELENARFVLTPGQVLTIPAGVLHRTRPSGERSVNLTFERNGAATVLA